MKPPHSSRPDTRKPGPPRRPGGGADRPRDQRGSEQAPREQAPREPGRAAPGGPNRSSFGGDKKPAPGRATYAARSNGPGKAGERSKPPYQGRTEHANESRAPFVARRDGAARTERPPSGAAAPTRVALPTLTARPIPKPDHAADRPTPSRRTGPAASGPRANADTPRGSVWLYGVHAVAAALANPARRLRRLMLTEEGEAAISAVLKQPWPVPTERCERPRLDQLLGRDVVHQGVALLADPLAPPSLSQAMERPGPILVLDQISDPRNVGAILRCAAAFGVAAVIAQDRNAPDESGALAKAASGALETVPLLRAVNIARTLIALKAAGCWVVGLASGGGQLSGPALAERRVALVLGSEGDGMRRLTRETCDDVAGIAMAGQTALLDSLNVSAAAAVALYELARR